jgi:curved DNA-binding protein CbpA
MISKENYYAVLEIVTTDIYTVQQIEIKKAYRRMALQFHPDKGHKGADVLFQRVQEAYEVLNDTMKQNDYHGWYISYFKMRGVSARAVDREATKRQTIVDNILGAEEAKIREQQRADREREVAERKAAEAKRKKKEARERARRAKLEAKRREEEVRKKEQERMKKVQEKERRENDVLERRRQEERAKAEERIRKLKEEELKKSQEPTRPSAAEESKSIPENLSKTDYLRRLQRIQESSSLMADERDRLTEESERLAKKAELIRSSAKAAFAKAKKKYEDSLKRSKTQLEKALQFDLESDNLHSQVLDMLEEYSDLTDFYGAAYGFPEEEEEEDSSDEEPLASTNISENSEVPSSFETPKKSPLSQKPMSAHEFVKMNGSPLNTTSSDRSSNNTPSRSTFTSEPETAKSKEAPTSTEEYVKHYAVKEHVPDTVKENQRTQSSIPIPGRSYAALRPRTHYSNISLSNRSTMTTPQRDTCTPDRQEKNDSKIVDHCSSSTHFAPNQKTPPTSGNASSPMRPDHSGTESDVKPFDFSTPPGKSSNSTTFSFSSSAGTSSSNSRGFGSASGGFPQSFKF